MVYNALIFGLIRKGLSVRKIAKLTGLSKSVVGRIRKDPDYKARFNRSSKWKTTYYYNRIVKGVKRKPAAAVFRVERSVIEKDDKYIMSYVTGAKVSIKVLPLSDISSSQSFISTIIQPTESAYDGEVISEDPEEVSIEGEYKQYQDVRGQCDEYLKKYGVTAGVGRGDSIGMMAIPLFVGTFTETLGGQIPLTEGF